MTQNCNSCGANRSQNASRFQSKIASKSNLISEWVKQSEREWENEKVHRRLKNCETHADVATWANRYMNFDFVFSFFAFDFIRFAKRENGQTNECDFVCDVRCEHRTEALSRTHRQWIALRMFAKRVSSCCHLSWNGINHFAKSQKKNEIFFVISIFWTFYSMTNAINVCDERKLFDLTTEWTSSLSEIIKGILSNRRRARWNHFAVRTETKIDAESRSFVCALFATKWWSLVGNRWLRQ